MLSRMNPGAMGKSSNPQAVVDSHGKVFGVGGLRIVDASIFPLLPPGHPQSTVCKGNIFILWLILAFADFYPSA